MRYVAFLRGINVGGNVLIKMSDLKSMFKAAGFTNVITVGASGNVAFDAPKSDSLKVTAEIEAALKQKWKRDIFVMVRSIDSLKNLEASQPFKSIKITPNTRLYITFLKDEPQDRLKLPYTSPEKNFRILKEFDLALISILEISPKIKTPDVMLYMEKVYGKQMTTRNWNTIQKILKAA